MKNFNTKRRLKATKSIIHKLWMKYHAVIPHKTEETYDRISGLITYWSNIEDELLIKENEKKDICIWR